MRLVTEDDSSMLNSNPSASSAHVPHSQPKAPRQCPVCHSALKPFRFHDIETDVCEKGCGVWFDEGEMKRVEESDTLANIDHAFPGQYIQQKTKPAPAASGQERQCPVHHTPMLAFEWNVGSGIVLDKCEACHGVWMDAGELEGYCQYLKNFYKHPPELTPAIREKMDKVRHQFEKEWDTSLDQVTQVVVPWDLWFIDDLQRHLLKAILNLKNSV
jgi:Zn-finger nucleic acid-binding protein